MKGGAIVESGTHEALISCAGEYCKLYNIQARAFVPVGSEVGWLIQFLCFVWNPSIAVNVGFEVVAIWRLVVAMYENIIYYIYIMWFKIWLHGAHRPSGNLSPKMFFKRELWNWHSSSSRLHVEGTLWGYCLDTARTPSHSAPTPKAKIQPE
jgi:hypothetical protein